MTDECWGTCGDFSLLFVGRRARSRAENETRSWLTTAVEGQLLCLRGGALCTKCSDRCVFLEKQPSVTPSDKQQPTCPPPTSHVLGSTPLLGVERVVVGFDTFAVYVL